MSVKQGLLALLAETPMGVYQLRKEFELRTGGTWPVNIGQVYTTVQRLERDGLIKSDTELNTTELNKDVERYRLTTSGREAAEGWWLAPVQRTSAERDELVIKLALALGAPGVDVQAVVQAQRKETMRALRDFTRLKSQVPLDSPGRDDLTWSLLLDHRIFAAEAEIRWLDHLEASARLVPSVASPPPVQPDARTSPQPHEPMPTARRKR